MLKIHLRPNKIIRPAVARNPWLLRLRPSTIRGQCCLSHRSSPRLRGRWSRDAIIVSNNQPGARQSNGRVPLHEVILIEVAEDFRIRIARVSRSCLVPGDAVRLDPRLGRSWRGSNKRRLWELTTDHDAVVVAAHEARARRAKSRLRGQQTADFLQTSSSRCTILDHPLKESLQLEQSSRRYHFSWLGSRLCIPRQGQIAWDLASMVEWLWMSLWGSLATIQRLPRWYF